MRVRFLLLNPTDHFVLFKLFDPTVGSTGESVSLTKEMIVEKYDTAINNSTEYDRGLATLRHCIQIIFLLKGSTKCKHTCGRADQQR